MWPFRSRKNKSPIPNEVQEYYQAERRERVGVAWLLAIATLVTTVLLAFGLYVGGRWVYRKVTNKQDKPTTTQGTKTQTKPGTDGQKPQTTTPSSNKGGSTPSNQPSSQNNDGATGNNVVSDGNDDDEQPSTPTAATNSTPKPTNSSTNTSLTNTGPGDTAAVFLGVSAVSGSAHYLYHRRKTRRTPLAHHKTSLY
jgi:hypothetical protein